MPQLMTQAEFARHRGVSKGSVTNWKNATPSLLVLVEEPGTGRIKVDVVRSEAKLNANLDPMRGRPTTGGAGPAPALAAPALPLDGAPDAKAAPAAGNGQQLLADERLEELRERRIGQAMKNEQLAGGLVPLSEAERRVSEVGRAARERIHAWFRGIAERVAAEKDVRAIMTIVETGIDQVFTDLADAALRGEFAGDDANEPDLLPGEDAELEAIDQ